MRTPEQNVAHHLNLYTIADAALNRAKAAFDVATKKGEAGIDYAKKLLIDAEHREAAAIVDAQIDVAKAQETLEAMEIKLARMRTDRGNTIGILHAKKSILDATAKNETLVYTVSKALDSVKAKFQSAESLYQEACAAVEAEEFKQQQENVKRNKKMRDGYEYEQREKSKTSPAQAPPKITAETELAEPPEGWAEFDRKANAEIQRKVAEKANTIPGTVNNAN